jgi:hypothetical protein
MRFPIPGCYMVSWTCQALELVVDYARLQPSPDMTGCMNASKYWTSGCDRLPTCLAFWMIPNTGHQAATSSPNLPGCRILDVRIVGTIPNSGCQAATCEAVGRIPNTRGLASLHCMGRIPNTGHQVVTIYCLAPNTGCQARLWKCFPIVPGCGKVSPLWTMHQHITPR